MPATFYNVTLPWTPSYPEDSGTYTITVLADDHDDAIRITAQEMIDSGQTGIDAEDAESVESYIQSQINGWSDVYETEHQLRQDIATLFEKQLFPDGVQREINLDVLGELLAKYRDELVVFN